MKVFGCRNQHQYGGGLVLVAANTKEEAYLTAAMDDKFSYIEYTRTDVIVEKACKWMKENFQFDEAGYCKTNIYSTDSMIYNFEKYIRS